MTDHSPELMTVSEAATVLRVSEMTIRRWSDSGRLPALRSGRVRRISRACVDQLLAGLHAGTSVDLDSEDDTSGKAVAS